MQTEMEKATKNRMDRKQSSSIWNMKAFAVIAIIACHCCHVSENASEINVRSTEFLGYWIGYGVPVFYFLSGYLFTCDERGILHFIRKKLVTIVVPWTVTGTAVWLYIVLRKGGMTLSGWVEYVFLRGSYLYFLTDLVLYFALFYAVRRYPFLRYLASGYLFGGLFINTVFRLDLFFPLYALGLPVSHTLVFYSGILAREYDVLKKFSERKWVLMTAVFIVIRWLELHEMVPGYLDAAVYLAGVLSLTAGLYAACHEIAKREVWYVEDLGRYSFPLYLLHMPAAGLVSRVLNRSEIFAPLTVLRPLIVIFITMILIKLYERLTGEREIFRLLIGER